jgi:excinuclease UvrABC nuclease subunit
MENWTLTWTGLIPLNETSIEEIPENLPGVYRLSYKDTDGNYYVFYVGQSENIKKRLLEHISNSESNVCMRNYINSKECIFRYAKVNNDYVRNAAEKQMYKHYEPTCNEKEPEGREDVQVNLN